MPVYDTSSHGSVAKYTRITKLPERTATLYDHRRVCILQEPSQGLCSAESTMQEDERSGLVTGAAVVCDRLIVLQPVTAASGSELRFVFQPTITYSLCSLFATLSSR